MKNILVENVDVELLKKQRNWLLEINESDTNDFSDGLVNLLDAIIDEAEE